MFLVHPFQPVANIQKTLVARSCVFLPAQFAQIEKAHQAESMIGGHDNHIPGAREITAILICRTA